MGKIKEIVQELFDTCQRKYEEGGYAAVIEYIEEATRQGDNPLMLAISYERCNACDNTMPSLNNVCLVCGQSTVPDLSRRVDTGMLGDGLCTEGLHVLPFVRKITGFNPGVVENIWSEIRNNYEEDGFIYIDAWEDENDDSDGRVIAKVNTATGEVEYKDPRAVNDLYAQEIIQLTLKDVIMRNIIELEYSCDMGSLKIGTENVSLFINNGFGDGRFKVRINLNKFEPTKNMKYECHFTVKTPGNVRIFRYDCSTDAIYTFTKTGRYFCFSENGTIYIFWNDSCITS